MHKSFAYSIACRFNLCIKFATFHTFFNSFQHRDKFATATYFNTVFSFCQFKYTCAVTYLQTNLTVFRNKPPLLHTFNSFNCFAFACVFIFYVTQTSWCIRFTVCQTLCQFNLLKKLVA
jgi:hypothetical protein